jgi:integrase
VLRTQEFKFTVCTRLSCLRFLFHLHSPTGHYDEPETLSYTMPLVCPIGADVRQYKWAMERGYANQSQIPLWSEIRKIVAYRNAMQREEYQVLYTYLRNGHKNLDNERDVYERQLVRDFILILANTGMRFGEARRIKWNFVQVKKSPPSNDGRTNYPNVHIRIPAELSKVKKDRTAIGMRGDIFGRIRTYSKHKHAQDFVFTDFNTGEAVSTKTLYRL